MAIEFHCEHCNHLIKAPDDAGGRTGKCPHCGNAAYIPRPDSGELELAPLDDKDEERRKQAAREAAALQHKLLNERAVPGEPPRTGKQASGHFVSPSRNIAALIVGFVEAMSTGKLEKADELAAELAARKADTVLLLDEMAREDLGAYGFPALPKPVLAGFLKQLRGRL